MARQNDINISVGYQFDDSNLKKAEASIRQFRDNLDSKTIAVNIGTNNVEQVNKSLLEVRRTADEVGLALQRALNPATGSFSADQFRASLANANLTINDVYRNLNKMGTAGRVAFRNLATDLTNINQKSMEFGKSKLLETFTSAALWKSAYTVLNRVFSIIPSAVNYLKDLDTSLNKIRIVTGKTSEDMIEFAKNANKAAQELSVATKKYTQAALTFYQQGLKDQDVEVRTNLSVKVANVSGLDTDKAADYVTSVLNGFQVNADGAEKAMDIIAKVGATTASSMSELAEAMSKVSSVAKTMGTSEEQLASQISTVVAVTRQSASTVGTAFKTIYSRIANINAGTSDAEISLSNYTQKMKEMGISVLGQNGKLKDQGSLLEEIGGKWKTMSKEQQVALAQTMAGTRQYNTLLTLFNNWDKYNQTLTNANNATGTLANQQEIYNQKTEAHIQKLKTAQEGFYSSLVDVKSFNPLIDSLTLLTERMTNISKLTGGLKGSFMNIFSILSLMPGKLNPLDKLFTGLANKMSGVFSTIQNRKNQAAERQNELNLIEEQRSQLDLTKKEDRSTDKILSEREFLIKNRQFMGQDQFNSLYSGLEDYKDKANEVDNARIKFEQLGNAVKNVDCEIASALSDISQFGKISGSQAQTMNGQINDYVDQFEHYDKTLAQLRTNINRNDNQGSLGYLQETLSGQNNFNINDILEQMRQRGGYDMEAIDAQYSKIQAKLTNGMEKVGSPDEIGIANDIKIDIDKLISMTQGQLNPQLEALREMQDLTAQSGKGLAATYTDQEVALSRLSKAEQAYMQKKQSIYFAQMAKGAMQIVTSLTQVAFAFNMISNTIEAFKSKNSTGMQKLTSLLMTLGLVSSALININKGIKELGGGLFGKLMEDNSSQNITGVVRKDAQTREVSAILQDSTLSQQEKLNLLYNEAARIHDVINEKQGFYLTSEKKKLEQIQEEINKEITLGQIRANNIAELEKKKAASEKKLADPNLSDEERRKERENLSKYNQQIAEEKEKNRFYDETLGGKEEHENTILNEKKQEAAKNRAEYEEKLKKDNLSEDEKLQYESQVKKYKNQEKEFDEKISANERIIRSKRQPVTDTSNLDKDQEISDEETGKDAAENEKIKRKARTERERRAYEKSKQNQEQPQRDYTRADEARAQYEADKVEYKKAEKEFADADAEYEKANKDAAEAQKKYNTETNRKRTKQKRQAERKQKNNDDVKSKDKEAKAATKKREASQADRDVKREAFNKNATERDKLIKDRNDSLTKAMHERGYTDFSTDGMSEEDIDKIFAEYSKKDSAGDVLGNNAEYQNAKKVIQENDAHKEKIKKAKEINLRTQAGGRDSFGNTTGRVTNVYSENIINKDRITNIPMSPLYTESTVGTEANNKGKDLLTYDSIIEQYNAEDQAALGRMSRIDDILEDGKGKLSQEQINWLRSKRNNEFTRMEKRKKYLTDSGIATFNEEEKKFVLATTGTGERNLYDDVAEIKTGKGRKLTEKQEALSAIASSSVRADEGKIRENKARIQKDYDDLFYGKDSTLSALTSDALYSKEEVASARKTVKEAEKAANASENPAASAMADAMRYQNQLKGGKKQEGSFQATEEAENQFHDAEQQVTDDIEAEKEASKKKIDADKKANASNKNYNNPNNDGENSPEDHSDKANRAKAEYDEKEKRRKKAEALKKKKEQEMKAKKAKMDSSKIFADEQEQVASGSKVWSKSDIEHYSPGAYEQDITQKIKNQGQMKRGFAGSKKRKAYDALNAEIDQDLIQFQAVAGDTEEGQAALKRMREFKDRTGPKPRTTKFGKMIDKVDDNAREKSFRKKFGDKTIADGEFKGKTVNQLSSEQLQGALKADASKGVEGASGKAGELMIKGEKGGAEAAKIASKGSGVAKMAGEFSIVAIAILAVIAAAKATYDYLTKEENDLHKQNAALSALRENAQKSAESYNNLKSGISKFKELKKAIDGCTRGTAEWEENMSNMNDTVKNLLQTYPDLIKEANLYDEKGNINEDVLDDFLDKKEKENEASQLAVIAGEIGVSKAQAAVNQKSLVRGNSLQGLQSNNAAAIEIATSVLAGIAGGAATGGALGAAGFNPFTIAGGAIIGAGAGAIGTIWGNEAVRNSIGGDKEEYTTLDKLTEAYKQQGETVLSTENILEEFGVSLQEASDSQLEMADKIREQIRQNAEADKELDNLAKNAVKQYTESEERDLSDVETAIYENKFKENYNSIYDEIIELGTKGIAQINTERNKQAKKIWKRYQAANSEVKYYDLTGVEGDDNHRKFAYNDGSGKKTVTLEQAASSIAAHEALIELGNAARDAANALAALRTNATTTTQVEAMQYYITNGSFDEYNDVDFNQMLSDIGEFTDENIIEYLKKLFDTDEEGLEEILGKDYLKDFKLAKDARNESLDNFRRDNVEDRILEQFDNLDNTENLTNADKKSLMKSMQDSFNYGTNGEFSGYIGRLDESQLSDFVDYTQEVEDWGKVSVTDLKRDFAELGILSDATDEELEGLIKTFNKFTKKSLTDLGEEIKTVTDITNKLTNGETINSDEYDKLPDKIKGCFTQLVDGTYKLVVATSKFKHMVTEYERKQIKDDIKEVNDNIVKLGGYYDFALHRETTQRTGENKESILNSMWYSDGYHNGMQYDAEGVSAQLAFLRSQEAFLEDDMQGQLEDWQKLADQGILKKDDVEKIAEYMKDYSASSEEISEQIKAETEKLSSLQIALLETASTYRELVELGYTYEIDDQLVGQVAYEMQVKEAEEGLDQEEISAYADYLQEYQGVDWEGANNVSRQVLRMDKGIQSLNEGYYEWLTILNDSSASAQETAKAYDGLKTSIADILDVSSEYVSTKVIVENLDDVKLASEGNEEAIERLREKVREDTMDRIIGENGYEGEIDWNEATIDQQEFESSIQRIQEGLDSLSVGQELGKEYIDEMNQIIEATDMTKDEVNAMFDSMGMDVEFDTETQEINYSVPKYVTYTKPEADDAAANAEYENDGWKFKEETITVPMGQQNLKGSVESWGMSVASSETGAEPVKIKKATKGAPASYNSFSSINSGGKTLGGKTKKKSERIDKIKDPYDKYHNVNNELKEIEHNMNLITLDAEKLTGAKKIEALNKELGLIQAQTRALKEKMAVEEQDLSTRRTELNGYGFNFDANGNVTNYEAVMQAYADQEDKYAEEINNGNDTETNQELYAQAQKNRSDAESRYQIYQQVKEQHNSTIEQAKENEYKETTVWLQRIELKVNASLDLTEAQEQWDEFQDKVVLKIKESDPDYLSKKAESVAKSYNYAFDNETGSVQWLTKSIQEILVNGDLDNQETIDALKTDSDKLMETLEAAEDKIDEVYDLRLKAIDKVVDAYKDLHDEREFFNDQADHELKMMQLLYGDQSYKKMKKYYEEKAKNSKADVEFAKQEADTFYNLMNKALEEGDRETYEKFRDSYESAVKDANAALEELASNVIDNYKNNLNLIFKELEEKLTNGLSLDDISGQLSLLQGNAIGYLDDIESAYQIQTLSNKYDEAIRVAKTTALQKKLNKIKNEELEILKKKDKLTQYDLERAQAKYEIAVKQQQLEEAQSAKTDMRLVRTNSGNYSYSYVADDSEIQQAEQSVLDAKNNLWEIDKEAYNKNLQDLLSMYQEYQNKVRAIYEDTSLSQEERARKLALVEEEYQNQISDLIQQNKEIRQNCMADVEIFTDNTLASMSAKEQNTLMEEMIPAWNSGVQEMIDKIDAEGGLGPVFSSVMTSLDANVDDLNSSLNDVKDTSESITEDVYANKDAMLGYASESVILANNLYTEVNNTYQKLLAQQEQYSEIYKAAELWLGKAQTKWGETEKSILSAATAVEKYNEQIAKTNGASIVVPEVTTAPATISPSVTPATSKHNNVTTPATPAQYLPSVTTKNVVTISSDISEYLDALLNGGNEYQETVSGEYKGYITYPNNTKKIERGSATISGLQFVGADHYSRTYKDKDGNEYSFKAKTIEVSQGAGARIQGDDLKSDSIYSYVPSGSSDGYSAYQGSEKTSIKDAFANGSIKIVGRNTFGAQLYNDDTKQQYYVPDYALKHMYFVKAYDTGGYTGEWGPEGRIALLHEKEIVLNKSDTKNLLDTVSSVREMTDNNVIKDLVNTVSETAKYKTDNILNQVSVNSGAISETVYKNMSDQLGNLSKSINLVNNKYDRINNQNNRNTNNNNTFNINADFPNASNVNDIQEALLNISNRASQFLSQDREKLKRRNSII